MEQFTAKYQDQILGKVSGFDRLILRGSVDRLNRGIWMPSKCVVRATGMEEYLWQNKILFKDYGRHVKRVSEQIKKASLAPFKRQDLPVVFLRSPSVDKDALARNIALKKGISTGLVCAISSLEPSPTFEHQGIYMIRRKRPCHVLYHYQIHPELGWMHARIQTWFPFHIQIGLNGREWLEQQMKREGLKYRKQGNCFVWIEDYQRAQELLDDQLRVNWTTLLDVFAQQLNPVHGEIFRHYRAGYYWTCYQSEWATDIVFRDADYLKRLMPILVRHGMLSFSSVDVMRYFGKRVNRSGAIPGTFGGTLQTDLRRYEEGERVKYRMNGNTAKFYDKAYSDVGSVLRGCETTINDPRDWKAYRPAQGGPEDDLQWRRMRKGVADLHRRAEVSQKSNERLLNALASVDDSRTLDELTASVQKPVMWKGRRARALRPWAEDRELLVAVNHGEFVLNGFRNRDLQSLLYRQAAPSNAERRRRSAAVSRKLRLLRAHGLIQKVQNTHRYHVSETGRTILVAILTVGRTSLQQLNQLKKVA
jgi:hypothetical protein